MRKFTKPDVLKNVEVAMKNHSPEILMGLGIAGMISTTILAVKATPKALKMIETRKREERVDKLSIFETVKATWICYIPSALTGTLSILCLVGANSVNVRRNAALAAAYSVSETALKDYRDKVVETIGEKKERAVQDAVAKEQITRDPVTSREVLLTNRGDTLCYDAVSGRYFKSDIETLRRAQNDINERLISEMIITLSEFYDEIGLKHTSISDDLGWNIEKGFLELHFSSQIADDGTPCLVMNYGIETKYKLY